MRSTIVFLSIGLVVIAGLPTDQTRSPLVTIAINAPANQSLGLTSAASDVDSPSLLEPELEPMTGGTRIVGGSATNIGRYPIMAAILRSTTGSNFRLWCGGSILNARTVITAAHCVRSEAALRFRFRVGSSYAHIGGRVIHVSRYRRHPSYRQGAFNADLALLRGATAISFNSNVRAVRWAGLSHRLNVGANVWAAGWGAMRTGGLTSEVLRHVQLQIWNHNTCSRNYARRHVTVTASMVCAGWPIGGRDQCQGDSGGPLLHNGVLVGISSFGRQCGLANYPGVNTRVSSFSAWITNNIYRS